MVHTVTGIRAQYLKWCLRNRRGSARGYCEYFIEDFDSYVKEAEMLFSRAQVLHERVQSTAQLVNSNIC